MPTKVAERRSFFEKANLSLRYIWKKISIMIQKIWRKIQSSCTKIACAFGLKKPIASIQRVGKQTKKSGASKDSVRRQAAGLKDQEEPPTHQLPQHNYAQRLIEAKREHAQRWRQSKQEELLKAREAYFKQLQQYQSPSPSEQAFENSLDEDEIEEYSEQYARPLPWPCMPTLQSYVFTKVDLISAEQWKNEGPSYENLMYFVHEEQEMLRAFQQYRTSVRPLQMRSVSEKEYEEGCQYLMEKGCSFKQSRLIAASMVCEYASSPGRDTFVPYLQKSFLDMLASSAEVEDFYAWCFANDEDLSSLKGQCEALKVASDNAESEGEQRHFQTQLDSCQARLKRSIDTKRMELLGKFQEKVADPDSQLHMFFAQVATPKDFCTTFRFALYSGYYAPRMVYEINNANNERLIRIGQITFNTNENIYLTGKLEKDWGKKFAFMKPMFTLLHYFHSAGPFSLPVKQKLFQDLEDFLQLKCSTVQDFAVEFQSLLVDHWQKLEELAASC